MAVALALVAVLLVKGRVTSIAREVVNKLVVADAKDVVSINAFGDEPVQLALQKTKT